jgi:hypothetical protein
MPLHARPIPAPANAPGGRNDPTRARVTLTSPLEDPPSAVPVAATTVTLPETTAAAPASDVETSPLPAAPAAAPVAAPDVAAATTARSAAPWPWYRREPWLPVMLAAFVPIGVGFMLPQAFHLLLIGVSALLVLLSTAMLIRQGPFREHPRPELPHDAEGRAKERRRAAA